MVHERRHQEEFTAIMEGLQVQGEFERRAMYIINFCTILSNRLPYKPSAPPHCPFATVDIALDKTAAFDDGLIDREGCEVLWVPRSWILSSILLEGFFC